MAVGTVSRNQNIRTSDVAGTKLVPSTVGQFLRDNGAKLKTISLRHPLSTDSIAKQLHLSKATAAKVMTVAEGYQNFGVDTRVHASVMLIKDKAGDKHQAILVGGPTTEAGKSIWKPGQDYKGTVIDGKNGNDVMHVRFQAKDNRHFVYMSHA